MIGFVVRKVVSETLIKEDGTWDDNWTPTIIDEEFCKTFDAAIKKYIEYLNVDKYKSWYPAYLNNVERNKIFFKIWREGTYNKQVYKTELQIEQCFFDE